MRERDTEPSRDRTGAKREFVNDTIPPEIDSDNEESDDGSKKRTLGERVSVLMIIRSLVSE